MASLLADFFRFCYIRAILCLDVQGGLENEAHKVVEQGQGHEQQQQDHTDHLGSLHEGVAEFAAGHHFVEEEEGVATVEGGDGEHVEEGQHQREEGAEIPECDPVPFSGEKAAHGEETTHALDTLGGEDVLQVAHVVAQRVPSAGNAGGDGLQEGVVYGGDGIELVQRGPGEAGEVVAAELQREGVGGGSSAALHAEGEGAQAQTVGGVAVDEDVAAGGYAVGIFVVGVDGGAVYADDVVAGFQSGKGGGAVGKDAIHPGGDEGFGKAGVVACHIEQAEVGRQCEGHFFALAQNGDTAGFGEGAIHADEAEVVGVEAGIVGVQGDVAIAEAELLCALVELKAVGHVALFDFGGAVGEEQHGVDEEGYEEIDHDAAEHHEQSLPGGLGAKLPGLYGLLELFLVHRLVDHAGYFDVAAEGDPTDGVGGVAATGLVFPEGKLVVEEEAESLYAYLEKFGKEKMAAFVEEDEEGEAENELQGLYDGC